MPGLNGVELSPADLASSLEAREALWSLKLRDVLQIVDYLLERREHSYDGCFPLERRPPEAIQPDMVSEQVIEERGVVRANRFLEPSNHGGHLRRSLSRGSRQQPVAHSARFGTTTGGGTLGGPLHAVPSGSGPAYTITLRHQHFPTAPRAAPTTWALGGGASPLREGNQ